MRRRLTDVTDPVRFRCGGLEAWGAEWRHCSITCQRTWSSSPECPKPISTDRILLLSTTSELLRTICPKLLPQTITIQMNNQPLPVSNPITDRVTNTPYPVRHSVSITPPPAYAPLPPSGTAAESSVVAHTPHLQSGSQLLLPHLQNDVRLPHVPTRQQAFGPTPISTSLPLLPNAHYESSAVAAARARWRFVGAMMVALGIYVFVAVIMGLEILGEMAGSLA